MVDMSFRGPAMHLKKNKSSQVKWTEVFNLCSLLFTLLRYLKASSRLMCDVFEEDNGG